MVKNPRTFRASDLASDSSCSNTVSITTATDGYSLAISLAAASPSRTGMSTSNRATSTARLESSRRAMLPFAAGSLTNSDPVRIVCLEIPPSMSPGICASHSSAPDRSISLGSSTAAASLGAVASRLSSESMGLRRREESCARSTIEAISPDRSGCAAASAAPPPQRACRKQHRNPISHGPSSSHNRPPFPSIMSKCPIYQMLHGEAMFRHRRTSGSNPVTSQCRTTHIP